jgi:dTDP-4-dehydrorhamnose reductase
MKILIIDGQGGKMGKMLVEQLKQNLPEVKITALGTNSIATAAMIKAGADFGATGENPVVFNCTDADIIIGPIGIIIANSLLGEITPSMALAIGQSKAQKILIPINRCNSTVVGVKELPFSEYVRLAIQQVKQTIEE